MRRSVAAILGIVGGMVAGAAFIRRQPDVAAERVLGLAAARFDLAVALPRTRIVQPEDFHLPVELIIEGDLRFGSRARRRTRTHLHGQSCTRRTRPCYEVQNPRWKPCILKHFNKGRAGGWRIFTGFEDNRITCNQGR